MKTTRISVIATAALLIASMVAPAVTHAAAVNTAEPTVSGSAKVGSVLKGGRGTWTDPTTFTQQWYRCDSLQVEDAGPADPTNGGDCVAIAGGTARSILVRSADAGKYLLFAVTTDGFTAHSATTALIAAVPGMTSAPVPDNGDGASDLDGVSGDAFAIINNVWTGSPDLSYRWYRCTRIATTATTLSSRMSVPSGCSVIKVEGANGARTDAYTSDVEDDAGVYLRVRVTASSDAGTRYVFSRSTTKLEFQPKNVSVPKVSGSARVDRSIKASVGKWTAYDGDSTITYVYQWFTCLNEVDEASATAPAAGAGCEEIADGDEATYVVTEADQGSYLLVRVTASNENGDTDYYSASTSTFVPFD
jgi:hypothetical protein